jgi:hypothetical protein
MVLSAFTPQPWAAEATLSYRAAPDSGAGTDAVHGVRLDGRFRAAGVHRSGVPPVSLPRTASSSMSAAPAL